jgi:hypothetical protein
MASSAPAGPSLTPLEIAMMQDRVLRDSITSLVDKERRLAELELLLRLSEAGAPLTSASGHHHHHHHHGPGEGAGGAESDSDDDEASAKSAAARIFDHTDPARVESASLSSGPALPSGMLRPRGGRPELSAAEAALLSGAVAPGPSPTGMSAPPKCGLDISRMGLTEDHAADLGTLFASLGGAAQTLRIIDARNNLLERAGATAIVDAVKRFVRLEACCMEDNPLGGKAGVGAVVDVCSRAPVMAHLGVTLDEAQPLPFALDIEIIPPGLPKKAPGADKKGARGRSASPKKGGAPAKKAASPGKGKAGAKGAAAAGPVGTVAHLSGSIRNNSSITSVSLAGSTLPREALLKFVSAWPPPAPILPSSAHAEAAKSADAAGAGKAAGKAAPAKSAPAARAKSPGKKGAGAGASKGPSKFVPLTCLDLSRCHIGALGATDLSVALGPIPTPGAFESMARLGSIYPYGTNSGMAEAQAAKPGGKGGAAVPVVPAPPYTPGQSVHGCLQYLRVLNLSSCGLTSHGVIPVLEAVASHTNFLSHLILRDNYLDDAAAAALAAALRINSDRVATVQADAAAHAILNHPMFLLTGQVPASLGGGPVPSLSPGSRIAHHLGVAAAGGLTASHFTPLRVVDVRNNPLALAGDPGAHPGCRALVDALHDLPHVLSIVGPEPSVESALHFKSASASWSSASPSLPFPDDILVGRGAKYPFDLAATAASARAAARGGAVGASAILSMPAGLATRACDQTLRKCKALQARLAAAQDDGPGVGSGATHVGPGALGMKGVASGGEDGFGFVIWRLGSPRAAQTLLHHMSANMQILNHNASRVLDSLPDAGMAQEAAAGAALGVLGGEVLDVGVPTGLIGHDEDTPVVRLGAAGWLLHSPRVLLEWRASYTGPASVVPLATAQTLVFHVFVCGPGGRPMTHIQSSKYTDGSRDRLHARHRTLARLGLEPRLDDDMLAGTDGKRSDENEDPVVDVRKRSDWQEAAGLDVPRPLGQHNDLSAALALPPSLTAQAVAAARADLVAWPVAWHSALLPSHVVTSVTDARVVVFAEAQQSNVRGVATPLTAVGGSAGPFSFGVHVLEAELVVVEDADELGGLLPPNSAANVHSDVAFTF